MITHKSVCESPNSIVLTVCLSSDDQAKKIRSFVKDFSETVGGIGQMAFVYHNKEHFEEVRNGLGLEDCEGRELQKLEKEISNRSICITWPAMKSYIEANSRFQTVSDKQVVNSDGLPVTIKAQVVDRYAATGLHILAYNECDELRNDPMVTQKANETRLDFLRGKRPTWRVFFFNDESRIPFTSPVIKCLIERDLVGKLVKNLQHTVTLTDKCMKTIPINHLPGTGATTIAMHVLWKLRREFRCVVMNGNSPTIPDFREVAEKLLGLRGLQEDDATVNGTSTKACKPILLLMDDFSYQEARTLQKKFQDLISEQKINFEKTVGIILCVTNSTSSIGLTAPDQIRVNSKFTLQESDLFRAKLRELQSEGEGGGGIQPENMLGFLVFSKLQNEPYISDLTMKILQTMEAYPNQKRLLLYLAIFKFFGDLNISESHCKDILGPYFGGVEQNFYNNLCEQAQLFIKMTRDNSFGSHSVCEINSIPVAQFLVQQTLKLAGITVLEAITNLVNDKTVMGHRFLKEKLASDLKTLLIRRGLKETKGGILEKEMFSPLITEIQRDHPQEALELFDIVSSGFETYKMEGKHMVLQAQARFLLNKGDFEESERIIKEAIEIHQDNFAFHDTLGQIRKKKLQTFVEKDDIESIADALKAGQQAIRDFRTAQNLYDESKTAEIFPGRGMYSDDGFNDDFSDFSQGKSPGLFGEFNVNLELADLVIKKLGGEVENEVNALRNFMEGKAEEVGMIFAKAGLKCFEEYAPTIAQLYTRSVHCTGKIVNNLEFKEHSAQRGGFDEASLLRKLSKRFGDIFSTSNFQKLPEILESKKPLEYKVEQVRKYIEINLVHNILPVTKFIPRDILLGLDILQRFKDLHSGKTESLDNKTKLSLLNIKFALSQEAPGKLITFEEAVRISSELALVENDVSEIYFWYTLLLWPNDESNAEKSPYYDEEKILKCVKRLKEINDSRATERFVNRERQRKVNEQKPLFFLTEGTKFDRVVSAKDLKSGAKTPKVKRLSGRIINQSYVEAVLPGGTKINVRASYLRWNRSSTASNVTFELGFSLEGPIAHNIEKYSEESDRIRAHNDGDGMGLPPLTFNDFEDLPIWEPIEQAIESLGEKKDTSFKSQEASSVLEPKGNQASLSIEAQPPTLATSNQGTVLDDDPAIVQVNDNIGEREKRNTLAEGKMRSSPNHPTKKKHAQDKRKDKVVQRLSVEVLAKLNPNSVFKREQFPEEFFQTSSDVDVLEETLQWAMAWRARRLERREYVPTYLPIEVMTLDVAFNSLSNAQLDYWMDIQRDKIMVLASIEMEGQQGGPEHGKELKANKKEPVQETKQEQAEKECR